MRRRFLALLLTWAMLGADASKFACPKSHLRRGLAAETSEDASAVLFSGGVSASNPSELSETTTSAPAQATNTASFSTRHEDEAADPSPTSQMSVTGEKERPSVAGRGRSQGRSLKQDDRQDDEAPESETTSVCENSFLTPMLLVLADLPCSLSAERLDLHLNETTRTWRINRSLLDDVKGDIQVIVNCTTPGDVLSFSPKRRIRPSSRVVIPWPLTLTAPVDSSNLEEGVFPRSDAKAIFTCPSEGEGVFLVR